MMMNLLFFLEIRTVVFCSVSRIFRSLKQVGKLSNLLTAFKEGG